MIQSSAPGKLILCGEHAVVYNQPAIALPVAAVQAYASVQPRSAGHATTIDLEDLGEHWEASPYAEQPLARLVIQTLDTLGIAERPELQITLRSTIPIASGMGSGAALGAALVRALAGYFGRSLDDWQVSDLVYESERGFHGTPSGIDNTVVSLAQPIVYQRQADGPPRIEPLALGGDLTLVIGDTGVRAPTRLTVGGVRERYTADPVTFGHYFQAIGRTVREIRDVLGRGAISELGALLDQNHHLLQRLGVSSPDLERLIAAALTAGAAGAKLSGGGGGGIMLALAFEHNAPAIEAALWNAGATRVIVTHLSAAKSKLV